jgi:hypothetical protein
MEMKSHLSEAELAEFLSDPAKGLGTHLEYCDACLHLVARLRETVAGLREAGTQPDGFWKDQQVAIRLKLAAHPRSALTGLPRAVWAAIVLLLAAGLLLLSGDAAAPPPQRAAAPDPDHELLLEVERVMQSNGPDSLQPAAYLVQEITQESGASSNAAMPDKEMRHEN